MLVESLDKAQDREPLKPALLTRKRQGELDLGITANYMTSDRFAWLQKFSPGPPFHFFMTFLLSFPLSLASSFVYDYNCSPTK